MSALLRSLLPPGFGSADFFRRMQMNNERIELRGDIDRRIIDVLDAVAKARNCSRMAVVEQALEAWRVQVVHESTLVVRLSRGEGVDKEA